MHDPEECLRQSSRAVSRPSLLPDRAMCRWCDGRIGGYVCLRRAIAQLMPAAIGQHRGPLYYAPTDVAARARSAATSRTVT